MEKVIIHQIPTGPFRVFTYIVACPKTREAVLIDPAGEEGNLADLIEAEGLRVNPPFAKAQASCPFPPKRISMTFRSAFENGSE